MTEMCDECGHADFYHTSGGACCEKDCDGCSKTYDEVAGYE